jgi:hypothetical protein
MKMKKTLLLGATYEVLNFIDFRKTIKHLVNEKVEIISYWEDYISFGNGLIKHPSIVKLKKPIKRHYYVNNFSRKALVKRDRSVCQYCNKKLSANQITIDHVVPRSQGGVTSFINCVVACQLCNSKKDNRTPDQAGMRLLRRPTLPSFQLRRNYIDNIDYWHQDWDNFLIM